MSVARLTAGLLSGPMLLALGIGGPGGPMAFAWVLLSAIVVGAASLKGLVGPRCTAVVAVVDVVAIVVVGATAPAGIGPMLLLGVVVLLHVPMRWGLHGALLAGPPVAGAAALFPSSSMTGVTSTPVSVVVVLAQVAVGYAVGRFVAGQDALHDQTSLTLSLTFEHSPAGTALAAEDGVLLQANPALASLCGTSAEELEGQRLSGLVVPEDAESVVRALAATTTTTRGEHAEEVRLLTRAGPHWVRLRLARVPAAGRLAARLVVQVEDVAEQRAVAERLAHDAEHDALTGLANRRVLNRRLTLLVGDPHPAAGLVLLDLDGFKAVNDLLGHEAGDDLLVVVAERLRAGLHPGEVALRLAGDEMVVLVADVSTEEDALRAGRRVLDGLVGPAVVRAGEVELRASAGVRLVLAGDDPSMVLRDADAALYRAKRGGRGRVEIACRDEKAAAQASVGAHAVG